MEELLTQTYYHNTVQPWLVGLGIMVASVVLGKAIYWVFSKIVRSFTRRTKNNLEMAFPTQTLINVSG